ncbi:MAG: CoA activase, partial [Spirochaetales bacterium]|nr:CoA activase [Spirochaetales bacterium]
MRMILSIDIGSVTASYVLLDGDGNIILSDYKAHRGEPGACISSMLEQSGIDDEIVPVAVGSCPEFITGARRVDDTVAWVTAALKHHPKLRSLLVVGGERFGLITLDGNGGYQRMKTNTSCAAGTGSFLDQQARRLNLEDGAQLAELALTNTGSVPTIASRCSVFAKTDIIHAQQEGYSVEEICDGICLGLARNAADVLFDNGKVEGPVVFIGGVAANGAVRRHLDLYLGIELVSDDYAPLYGAIGAAYCVLNDGDLPEIIHPRGLVTSHNEGREYFFPKLDLSDSVYPDFDDHSHYLYTPTASWRESAAIDNPVEVDCYSSPDQGTSDAIIGIDIGSTSTKSVVVSPEGTVYSGFYTRTAGKPVEAVQALFEAVDNWVKKAGAELSFSGAATTGSGRKLIGEIVNADLVIDEISAHARAAVDLQPNVDTIIEVGGQDSKFTSLREGRVTFSRMNTVCAAGTGSFLEEQADRLGIPISEFADLAIGSKSPLTSDRCTVFMERDINCFLSRNYETPEILAGSAHSVCENYLLKVASEGHIGSVIVFQGATAKNRALVAAFEQKLGRGVFVSRYCHLTGAYGAALSLIESESRETSFRGISISSKRIPVSMETCGYCGNNCRITVADIDGATAAYGFLCGRDYETDRF